MNLFISKELILEIHYNCLKQEGVEKL